MYQENDSLQHLLRHAKGKKLDVKINDNRSTMLSVKWEPHCTKVSLHRIFLNAPLPIMHELSRYLFREVKQLSPSFRSFVEESLQKLDYSKEIDLSKLQVAGKIYDLKAMYDSLNAKYFDKSLNLHITWFGDAKKRGAKQITFGLYYDPLRLIKIHRLLDSNDFAPDFLEYVIYHEMVHHVCPAYIDKSGRKQIHSKEFKAKERKFEKFALAQDLLKQYKKALFSSKELIV